MEQAEIARLREQLDTEVRRRFPDAPIDGVNVLQYGDHPEVEPGQLLAQVRVNPPEGEEGAGPALHLFHEAHRAAINDLRRDLGKVPGVALLEFVSSSATGGQKRALRLRLRDAPGAESLTAVMARLGPEDLQTLDTLITTGIAGSRAEGLRWALARIRERPAYEQLRARAREIEDLKSQF